MQRTHLFVPEEIGYGLCGEKGGTIMIKGSMKKDLEVKTGRNYRDVFSKFFSSY